MKKIFLFAIAGLALASCSDDEEFVAQNGGGLNVKKADSNVLNFSTYIAGGTRAAVVGVDKVKESGFKVNAVYNGKMYISNDLAKNNLGYFDGVDSNDDGIRTDNQDGIFDTEKATYYWPVAISEEKPMTFYAFNNCSDDVVFVEPATDPVTANAMKLTYNLPDHSANQKDLVVAKAVASEKPANGVQPLNFTHAFAKVNFSFKGADNSQYTYTEGEGDAAQTNTGAKYRFSVNKLEVLSNSGSTAVDGGEAIPAICEIVDETSEPLGQGAQSTKVKWTQINAVPRVTSAQEANGHVVIDKSNNDPLGGTWYTYAPTIDATGFVYCDGSEAFDADYNLLVYPHAADAADAAAAAAADNTIDVIAVRVYYKIEDLSQGGELVGNCGFDATDYKVNGAVVNTTYGYKTVLIPINFEAGKSYRFTLELPVANYIGDINGDGNPDEVAKAENGASAYDSDGDGDWTSGDSNSEFDNATPIRFSVTVSNWEDAAATDYTSGVTIK